MSKHEDYVFRERSQRFDHAVGFAGKVDNLSGKEKIKKDNKDAYYYFGSSKKQEKESFWIDVIPLLAFFALMAFGFGLFWGLAALACLLIYISGVFLISNRNKK
jgi:hypothetical protein